MAAPGATGWLSLGAAPVFALMALWTGLSGQPEMLCMPMQGTWSLNGMALMYTLMCLFHSAPWLALFSMALPGVERFGRRALFHRFRT